MKGKKDIRVLLVDDDPIQINWAKQQLKDYNLTVATTSNGRKLAMANEKFDILILDLNLPENNQEKPTMKTGLNQLTGLLYDWQYGNVTFSAIALVSNYEHHVADKKSEPKKKETWEIMHELSKLRSLTAQVESRTYSGFKFSDKKELFRIRKRKNMANAVVIMADALQINDYPYYFFNKKAVTNEEICKIFPRTRNSYVPGMQCVLSGGVPLKPYSEVVEYLSQFCQD